MAEVFGRVGDVSPNPRKFRQVKFSPATITPRSITRPLSRKVENWPGYEAGLRQRGSLTSWIEEAPLENWQTFGPGGQARYADIAIPTCVPRMALDPRRWRQS
jgi:hypothetical protein